MQIVQREGPVGSASVNRPGSAKSIHVLCRRSAVLPAQFIEVNKLIQPGQRLFPLDKQVKFLPIDRSFTTRDAQMLPGSQAAHILAATWTAAPNKSSCSVTGSPNRGILQFYATADSEYTELRSPNVA